ncbi:hypothetical protein EDD16DRAFT_1517261 [Pisolithus croceorrhizus]|nr:hypothetical protein EV401DRAFT_1893075 [Pisolithus croceorrhizus]KAI6125016.1 hypothetical protein EDD16DRAFT_1517261 [Pisolithus croceorrhizus]KAI6161903.1 hypothetical protein EDD17DRAFT_1508748 [Pisolithus thermaeus]
MAKGSTRKGVMMIGSTPGQQVKQLAIRMWKANGWQRSQLVEVAIKEPVVETPVNPSSSSLLTKQSRSPSKHQFLSKDGVDNVFNINYPPMEPMRLPQKKMQNDYICEWLPQKEDFLGILLDLEAPPLPHTCKICGKDGVYRIQQWTRDFFEDSALHMDLMKRNEKTLTTSPSTFIRCGIKVPDSHQSTVFTFLVLDDFLRDNVDCGTSGMNYHSKLQELLWVAWQWHLLKLLKWSRYQGNLNHLTKGDLAQFCMVCPQPGINLSPQDNLDDWRYTRTVVVDGNFKAEHRSATPHIMEKSACNNHKVISQASASDGKLNSTGVGATACAWHGCFYPHSVVDFQKGERLNEAVPSSQQENWWRQEEAALKDHVHDPSVMDIFEIQLMKAPTVLSIELHLLQTSPTSGMHHGAASWLTCGLVIEEAEVALAISQKAIGPNPSDLK